MKIMLILKIGIKIGLKKDTQNIKDTEYMDFKIRNLLIALP